MPLIKGTSALRLVADFMVDDSMPSTHILQPLLRGQYPPRMRLMQILECNVLMLTERVGEPIWSAGKEVISFILKSAAIKREQSRLVLKPGLVQACYPHTAPKAQLRCTIAGLAVGISLLSLFEGSRERQVKSTIPI